jgi:hypothetical protein
MAFAGKSGFRGIVEINDTFLRFSSFDITAKQEPNTFLPAYGGTGLKTIFSKGTMDISGTMTGPLLEDKAQFLYDLTSGQQEFMMDVAYFDNQMRRFLGCKIESLSFNCVAGDFITFSANIVAKTTVKKSKSLGYTRAEKIYTHDKCLVAFSDGAYQYERIMSFTYNITNGYKTIKTGASLTPTVLGNAIQDVSGQIAFLNSDELVLPLTDGNYGLVFNDTTFTVGDLEVQHDIVIHPMENIPLGPGVVVTNINWTRADSYYGT